MNILKIGLVLMTGLGFGFGVEKLAGADVLPNDSETYYGHMEEGYCHSDGDFLDHMLEDLTDEELILVQAKIDELLLTYSITLEELNDDFEVRDDFMNDLMVFLDDNNIEYHNHGAFHDDADAEYWHGGMGMH